MTSNTGSARRIWEILKKVCWVETCLGRRRLAFAGSQRQASASQRKPTVAQDVGGGRWKSQNRKNVYLSPDVEELLNSKVIKSFVPELRSRKCFLCFEILCSMYIYIRRLWTFCVPVWICPFHISVSGYGTHISFETSTSGPNVFLGGPCVV